MRALPYVLCLLFGCGFAELWAWPPLSGGALGFLIGVAVLEWRKYKKRGRR